MVFSVTKKKRKKKKKKKKKKKTESKNSRIVTTKNGEIIISNCEVGNSKKSRFIKEQVANGLLNS